MSTDANVAPERGAQPSNASVASPGGLLVACIVAAVVACAGVGIAGAAVGLVGSAYDDGREWLDGLVEGLLAGAIVLLGTLPAMAWALRRAAGRGGAPSPGWAWAAGAVGAGVLVPCLVAASLSALTGEASYAAQDRATTLALLTSPVTAIGAAWLVLLAWRRRSAPQRLSGRTPGRR